MSYNEFARCFAHFSNLDFKERYATGEHLRQLEVSGDYETACQVWENDVFGVDGAVRLHTDKDVRKLIRLQRKTVRRIVEEWQAAQRAKADGEYHQAFDHYRLANLACCDYRSISTQIEELYY